MQPGWAIYRFPKESSHKQLLGTGDGQLWVTTLTSCRQWQSRDTCSKVALLCTAGLQHQYGARMDTGDPPSAFGQDAE